MNRPTNDRMVNSAGQPNEKIGHEVDNDNRKVDKKQPSQFTDQSTFDKIQAEKEAASQADIKRQMEPRPNFRPTEESEPMVENRTNVTDSATTKLQPRQAKDVHNPNTLHLAPRDTPSFAVPISAKNVVPIQNSVKTPSKSQSQQDEEMKRQIKAQLASQSTVGVASSPFASSPMSTLRGGCASRPAAPTTPSQEDEERKRQIKSQLTPQSTMGVASSPFASSLMYGQGEPISVDSNFAGNRISENSQIESQAGNAGPDQGDAMDENINSLEPTLHSQVGDTSNNPLTSLDGTKWSPRRESQNVPSSSSSQERPGAYSIPMRAHGGMPAWARHQAQHNRPSSSVQASSMEANLPPEMRREYLPQLHTSSRSRHTNFAGITTVDAMPIVPSETKETVLSIPLYEPEEKVPYCRCAIIFVVIVGVAIGITLAITNIDRGDHGTKIIDTSTAPPTQVPSLDPARCPGYPDIYSEPTNLDDAAYARYMELMDTTAPRFWPEYADSASQIEFCTPLHMALVWLADDDVDYNRTEVSVDNRLLLSSLFYSTNGNLWRGDTTGWLTTDDECSWAGVVCQGDEIIALNVGSQFDIPLEDENEIFLKEYLPFPSEVLFLTNLRLLKLNDNHLQGTVPASLEHLTDLDVLDLSGNSFSGNFPFSALTTNLRSISLIGNGVLDVRIPDDVGKWTNLEMLSLAYTGLGGEGWMLPSDLSSLTNLAILHLDSTQLEGSLPADLGDLTNLELLDLGNTHLSGSIPTSIGRLTKLGFLDLQRTSLEGTIPTEIATATSLKAIVLHNIAGLSGPVPSEIGSLTALEHFVAHATSLTGTLPSELGRCSMLEFLLFGWSEVQGILPEELGQLSNLTYIDISRTFIEGTIPSAILTLPRLVAFDATLAFLRGTITFEAFNAPYLECLDLFQTPVTGVLTMDTCEFSFDKQDLAQCQSIGREDCNCCEGKCNGQEEIATLCATFENWSDVWFYVESNEYPFEQYLSI